MKVLMVLETLKVLDIERHCSACGEAIVTNGKSIIPVMCQVCYDAMTCPGNSILTEECIDQIEIDWDKLDTLYYTIYYLYDT